MWGVHLNGARKLLESAGAVRTCQRSARVRAQVAMLVWYTNSIVHFSISVMATCGTDDMYRWDITVAFISRKRPRLPLTYLETLMAYNESDGWSFFTLNGCPAEFVMAMAQLAKLSSIYEQTSHMEWTIFNKFPVDVVIEEVKAYHNEEEVTSDDFDHLKEDPEARRNRFHCVEAWRHTIILYACRVFTLMQDENGMRLINHLARVILDHVRCIPHTDILQKQVLLPVFLAASEVGDERNRAFVRRWCSIGALRRGSICLRPLRICWKSSGRTGILPPEMYTGGAPRSVLKTGHNPTARSSTWCWNCFSGEQA